ncbi:MAG: M48 family metalloprotease [Thermodesulfobacteriota bacterium]
MKPMNRRRFLGLIGKGSVFGFYCLPWLSGCQSIGPISTAASKVGVLDPKKAQAIVKTSQAIAKTFEDITPEQEYYIGRTIGAMILTKYKPYNNANANRYINLVGQTLAMASNRPETFGGYHFLILDSSEINAFAAPGGFIFIARGLLKCCRSEDSLAAVLAHEVGHVQEKHGLKAIENSRVTSALTILGAETAKAYGGADLARLTDIFEESISDIFKTMVTRGYSRSQEQDADKASVNILKTVGYSPQGLVDMLKIMEKTLKPEGHDFAKTHPSPGSRIKDIQDEIGKPAENVIPEIRKSRFTSHLHSI